MLLQVTDDAEQCSAGDEGRPGVDDAVAQMMRDFQEKWEHQHQLHQRQLQEQLKQQQQLHEQYQQQLQEKLEQQHHHMSDLQQQVRLLSQRLER